VIEPACFPSFEKKPHENVLRLVRDLRAIDPPVTIDLISPAYLADSEASAAAVRLSPFVAQISDAKSIPTFDLAPELPEPERSCLLEDSEQSRKALQLMALADGLRADGMVTVSKILIDARYPIYQHHRIPVVPLDEFADILEICAHGHSIFLSASHPDTLPFDVFYQMTHWKNARLSNWFERVKPKIKDEELSDNLRSAMLNRYPFLLYSRDMVRFYQLQRDHYSKRGHLQPFGMALGYFVTHFYLLLWGMLDHLAVIAKYALNLHVAERHCGIRKKAFWAELEPRQPGLCKFLRRPALRDWIGQMADMRHAAAHKTIAIPAPLVSETEESQKPEEEVLSIVRERFATMFSLWPEFMKKYEPLMVWHWRISKMKIIAEDLVRLEGSKGMYMRSPVLSIDYDLERVTAVMDAFLFALFG
jgi:hypothetical protein